MEERYFTSKEVAEVLKVAEATVWKWVREGNLKAIQIANHTIRIPESALKEFINSRVING